MQSSARKDTSGCLPLAELKQWMIPDQINSSHVVLRMRNYDRNITENVSINEMVLLMRLVIEQLT